MKICIIANRDKDKDLQVSNEICALFARSGIDCFICETVIKNGRHYTDPSGVSGADIAVVIGGDGTLIQAARDLNMLDISFIGVNLGTLGYLTEISVNDIADMVSKIASQDYLVENRMMITGTVTRNDAVICENFALNDAVIYKNGYGQMVSVDVLVNDQLLSEYDADGMLIATPTGSTAYNLSAGGPLIVPSADMMVLTPICAHILNARSVVIPADSTVQIIIKRRKAEDKELELHFDGADVISIKPGDRITIKKMDHHTSLIRMSSTSFYKVLQKKLQNKQ